MEMPVLFDDSGVPVLPLILYQLTRRGRSLSWHRRLMLAVRLLLEYAEVHRGDWAQPEQLFGNFVAALQGGTTEAGLDASGLFWMPRRPSDARSICRQITQFSAHLARRYGTRAINPNRDATWQERICRYAAITYKIDNHFLAHLSAGRNLWRETEEVETSSGQLRREPYVFGSELAAQFPPERFCDLVLNGFAVNDSRDPCTRVNVRDVLITLLQHGGGLRCSEVFHAFINDVAENPLDPSIALVRIGHPSLGRIQWVSPDGEAIETSRAEYLARNGLVDRFNAVGPMHVGWKNPTLDGKFYLEVRWSDPDYGRLFLFLWKIYRTHYLRLSRLPEHPWAWINFEPAHAGQPLKLSRYRAAHARAVQRIGLRPAKHAGTTPHGHRHSCATWLLHLGISSTSIARYLHHHSIHSQEIYKHPDAAWLNQELNAGISRLNSNLSPTLFANASASEAEQELSTALRQNVNMRPAAELLDVFLSGRLR